MTELADRSQHLTDGVDSSKDTIEPPRPEEPLPLHQEALPEVCPPAVSTTPDDHLVARWCATPVAEVAEKICSFSAQSDSAVRATGYDRAGGSVPTSY